MGNKYQDKSLAQDFCEFCQIRDKATKTDQILAENSEFFAFHDISKASAIEHVLVCTKQHIQSVYQVTSLDQLYRMESFGQKVMTDLYKKRFESKPVPQNFRFGFHIPPAVSVFHIHLHCFTLPFKNRFIAQYRYGYGPLFKSVSMIAKEWFNKRGKL